MSPYLAYPWIIPLLALLLYGALLQILALRRRWSLLERRFALYLIAALFNALAYAAAYGYWAYPWFNRAIDQAAFYTQAALPLFFYAFAAAFLQRAERRAWVLYGGAAVWALLVIADLSQLVLYFTFGSVLTESITLTLRLSLWLVPNALIILQAARALRRALGPLHRNRLLYLALALTLFAATDALDLLVGTLTRPLSLILQMSGVSLLAYAILRHQLADLRYLIRQVLNYVLLTAFTVGVYIGGIEAGKVFFGGQDPRQGLTGVIATAVGLALFYQPLRDVIQRLLESVLFGRRYNYQRIVGEYSQRISGLRDLETLAAEASELLKRALGARDGSLLIATRADPHYTLQPLPRGDAFQLDAGDPVLNHLLTQRAPLLQYDIDRHPNFQALTAASRAALRDLRAEVFVPISMHDALVGLWVIGAKTTGDRYTAQDLALLATLADQTAVALENARLLDHLRAQVRETASIKEHLDSTLASIASGVVTFDRNGKITGMNRAAEAILNVSGLSAIGQSYEDALPTLEGAQLQLSLARLWAKSAQHLMYHAVANVPERGLVTLSLHLSPLKQGDQVAGAVMVVEDLTEQATLEAERRSQEQEKQRVRVMFQHYVAPSVVERLLADPRRVALGGERQFTTILFGDFKGFTALSEQLSAEELVQVLNGYLSLTARIVLEFEGTLDKFMGDAIMAIYNAPLPQPDHALRAVHTASAIQRAIAQHAASLPEHLRLTFRIGIHTGEAVVGNIGTPELMNYTAVGDAVNVAKRLQENARPGQVLISDNTRERVQGLAAIRPLESLTVKGRVEPVMTYEIVEGEM